MLLWIVFGCKPAPKEELSLATQSWEEIVTSANGQKLTLVMWQGDPLINKYMNDFVKPTLKEQYGISLETVNGQGSQIVTTLMTEMQATMNASEVDMLWINGETFFQLRQIDALFGPFVEKLPNSKYIDLGNPYIGKDFQQDINGFECPWGNVQMALIYNSVKVENPPMTLEELESWVIANPGKFTIGNDFTGMTLMKAWLAHFAGGKNALNGKFDQAKYDMAGTKLWEYINRIKPYFWNGGKSFPASVAQMHQLFASGELWFTMSNNDAEVDNKINEGIFADGSRAYVPATGSIQNSHYLGIAKLSAHKAAALVAINFMISPEAQYEKFKPRVWGDGTVLRMNKLPEDWQSKFKTIPGRKYAPDRSEIQDRAIMEPAPEYMVMLYDDFRKNVIEK